MNLNNEKQLQRVLKQFDVDTLFKRIFPIFSQWVTCSDIASEVRRLKYKPDQASVINIFITLLKDTDFKDEDIEDKLPSCMLLGVALNPTKKTWTAYTLEGKPLHEKSEGDYETDMKHFFLQNGLHTTTTVKSVDTLLWVQVIEKKLIRNRLKVFAPFYVAHFRGEPHMFMNKRVVSDDILQSLSEGFGYTAYKYCNLNGHDLDSLLKHLNQKGVKRGYAAPMPSGNFKVTSCGKDFSQHDNRRKFISDLMGSSPPKLSNYVVLAKNLPWKGRLYPRQMHAKPFDMKIEFRTEDTVEMLKDMAECGCLKVPPPSYVVNLLSTGKNNIKLRVQGTNPATDTENFTDA